MAFTDLYFSLGSNLGDRRQHILDAVDALDGSLGVRCAALSHIIETEPWGFGSRNRFLNACVRYRIYREADVTAQGLRILAQCKEIERRLGRSAGPGYAADGSRIYRDRPIDIDILFIGAEHIDTETLTVPHPLIAQRDFVLIPLREIAKPALKRAFPDLFD